MIHVHVQLEGKRNLFYILFNSYSSFKLVGIHEHDKMVAHSCYYLTCLHSMHRQQTSLSSVTGNTKHNKIENESKLSKNDEK